MKTLEMRRRRQEGFSLIELLIVITIILIIAAIAIPKLLTVKKSAGNTAAVANLKALNQALTGYMADQHGYPQKLTDLTIAGGGDDDYIDSQMATGSKQGYTFKYTAGAASGSTSDKGVALTNSYTITATDNGGFGTEDFCSSTSGTIRYQLESVGGAPVCGAGAADTGSVIGG